MSCLQCMPWHIAFKSGNCQQKLYFISEPSSRLTTQTGSDCHIIIIKTSIITHHQLFSFLTHPLCPGPVSGGTPIKATLDLAASLYLCLLFCTGFPVAFEKSQRFHPICLTASSVLICYLPRLHFFMYLFIQKHAQSPLYPGKIVMDIYNSKHL